MEYTCDVVVGWWQSFALEKGLDCGYDNVYHEGAKSRDI